MSGASPFVELPPYPIVPPYPGVPPLPIPVGGLPYILPILAAADALGIPLYQPPPQWGIFGIGGQPLLAVDSVYAIEYSRDYNISDYPQQQGSFQSYNKVIVPFEGKLTFLLSDSRETFLNTIEDACASLQLVTIVTPEVPYLSANLTHYSYRREARSGVTLIRVDVWCKEVRITAGTELSPNSANPPGPGTASTAMPATSPNPTPSSVQVPTQPGQQAQYYTPTPAAGSMAAAQSVNAAPQQNDGVVQPVAPTAAAEAPPGQPFIPDATVDLTPH